jgi:enoyl-CoA hydratase/carnithine racemase
MLAMYHDYRIMNPYRGYLCLNELEFGAPLASPMASIFRQKLPNPNTFRTMILESKRFNALESLKEGIVDGLGGWEETKAFLEEMKLVGKAESGVYGKLKEEMWRETVGLLDGAGKEGEEMRAKIGKKREEESLRRVEEWERERESGSNGKTKL